MDVLALPKHLLCYSSVLAAKRRESRPNDVSFSGASLAKQENVENEKRGEKGGRKMRFGQRGSKWKERVGAHNKREAPQEKKRIPLGKMENKYETGMP